MPVHHYDDTREIKPPVSAVGPLGWIRANLFSSWLNAFLTVAVLYGLWCVVPPLFRWAFVDALWNTPGEACKTAAGACWSVVTRNIRFIIFGFYPYDQHWRPLLSMLLLFGLLTVSQTRAYWNRRLIYIWAAGLLVMGVLMKGGVLGLSDVESSIWSGLPLTLLLSVFGLALAYPLGVVLALGRQSRMPAIKTICVVYIELIRGVPLISLLFMSSIMFPLFLPEGVNLNKILRAQAAIILFTAAYIAEVVRGGLQAIPRGQYEAAESWGSTIISKCA